MRHKSGGLAPHLPAMRAAFAEGLTTYAVAKRFGASFHSVRAIRQGKSYPEGATVPWLTRPSAVVNTHCGWCRTGRRAALIESLRVDSRTNLRELAKRYHVGYGYARKIRSKATALGCLPRRCKCGEYVGEDGACTVCIAPVPVVKSPIMPWLLPPIGALYVRRQA